MLRCDPVRVAIPVTFLAGAAARAGENILTALTMHPLLLQQLVHPLDDALQALVHVQPHFLPLLLVPVYLQRRPAVPARPPGHEGVLVIPEHDLLLLSRGGGSLGGDVVGPRGIQPVDGVGQQLAVADGDQLPGLVCQDGERSFEASGRPVLGRPREPLCVVTDLGFQGVDLGDDLLGSDNILWYVDYGLAAGRRMFLSLFKFVQLFAEAS